MAIKDDFSKYFDGNWLASPCPGKWKRKQAGSENGTMFTSEVYIILKKNGQLKEQDKIDYNLRISQCIDNKICLLNRYPIGQNQTQDSPDNYLGVANGCMELGNTSIPRKLLKGWVKYLGFVNNVNPGKKTWQSFLMRQPQIFAAIVAAAFPSLKNPLHYLVRLLAFPFFFVAALTIGISCINIPNDQADPRRLSWHLQNNTKKVSLMCWLASKIWEKRLYKNYGSALMTTVAGEYYFPKGLDQNPYSKWWIT